MSSKMLTFRCWCGNEKQIAWEDYTTAPYGPPECRHSTNDLQYPYKVYPMEMTAKSERRWYHWAVRGE